MIEIESFIKELRKNDLNFCSGVPDSLFKDLCYGFERKYKKNHIIAANEGSAIAIGVGYYLSSNKIPIVYMQNSGLSNDNAGHQYDGDYPGLSLAGPKDHALYGTDNTIYTHIKLYLRVKGTEVSGTKEGDNISFSNPLYRNAVVSSSGLAFFPTPRTS